EQCITRAFIRSVGRDTTNESTAVSPDGRHGWRSLVVRVCCGLGATLRGAEPDRQNRLENGREKRRRRAEKSGLGDRNRRFRVGRTGALAGRAGAREP